MRPLKIMSKNICAHSASRFPPSTMSLEGIGCCVSQLPLTAKLPQEFPISFEFHPWFTFHTMKAEWIGSKQEEKWETKINPMSYSEFCKPRIKYFISFTDAKKTPKTKNTSKPTKQKKPRKTKQKTHKNPTKQNKKRKKTLKTPHKYNSAEDNCKRSH